MLSGRAPYNSLLTHGFVVDGQGRKMSKSVGNVIAPQKVSDSLGAEILRLWVASTDYSGELSISDEILKRVVEGYRRIRNTLRFLLANLADFDAAKDAVAIDAMLEIDRYALAMTASMQAEVLAAFDRYEFQPAMSRLQHFCSEDLGAFYLDVLKDRLYTSAPRSIARRSAQTALLHITQSLLKLMAPVLSFTAEEAWGVLTQSALKTVPAIGTETIFTECYHALPAITDSASLATRWSRLREIRGLVMRKLEDLRTAGDIGSSLQGEVDLTASGADLALLQSVAEQLSYIFIVSRVGVHAGAQAELMIAIAPSTHKKCERCWHWRDDIGQDAEHPHICGRCVSSLHEAAQDTV
jgi:isoleucyl-tRNA synthetase